MSNPAFFDDALRNALASPDWEWVVKAVAAGGRIGAQITPRVPDPIWKQWFPEGLSEENAAVLAKAGFGGAVFDHGMQLIHYLAELGDAQGVGHLLDMGIDPNQVGSFGMRPLTVALYGNGGGHCAVDVALLLLSRGADPNVIGLGSTGRPTFVFIEALNDAFKCKGQMGVNQLWEAFDSAGANWSLPYEGAPGDSSSLLNYFLLDVCDRYKPESAPLALFLDAALKLQVRGLSFDPGYRSTPKDPTLRKYVKDSRGNSQWLLEAVASTFQANALSQKTANYRGPPRTSRL